MKIHHAFVLTTIRRVAVFSFLFTLGLPVLAQPTQVIDGGLFYDPPTHSLLTLGGWGPPNWEKSPAAWSFNQSGWSALPDIPEGITHTGAAYDEAHQRMIVMGGVSPMSTWAYDGTSWSKIAEPLTSDFGYDPEIIYDEENQEIILYFSAMSWDPTAPASSETYILGDTGWIKQTVNPSPGAGADVGFVYDNARKEGVWFNGQETWSWKNHAWTQKQPASSPSFEFGEFSMAFDQARQVAVVYGRGETWTWDGTTWTKQTPATSPPTPERGFFAFGYDPNRQVVVLFGGEVVTDQVTYDAYYLDDIWEWNGSTWRPWEASTTVSQWSLQ